MYIIVCYSELFVAGIPPRIVPNVTFVITEIKSNIIAITLSWGEPNNNFDPILNYTVSCSSNTFFCSRFHVITRDNSTRSNNITSLTPMTNYIFSVVANNSIGSGEAGVVNVITPGEFTVHEYICIYYSVFGNTKTYVESEQI